MSLRDPNLRSRVVVVGSLNMDLIVRTERLPGPGETVLGGAFHTAAGGKGANQAVAAARLGASVSMIGCVGSDEHGRQLLEMARSADVNVDHVHTTALPTGVALIVVDALGQNLIAVAQGANGLVSREIVRQAGELIAAADIVVAQLEVPLEAIASAGELARDAGVPFLLNAAPAREDIAELLSLVTLLVVNETELAVVGGRQVTTGQEEAAARELLVRGPKAIIVTLGARGSVLVDDGGSAVIPPYPVQVVDSTAAGDAFVGAVAARYSRAESLASAARYASAAGALACTRPGAQPSLPTAEEVASLISE